jgi:predicted YcjX-like family ATPase
MRNYIVKHNEVEAFLMHLESSLQEGINQIDHFFGRFELKSDMEGQPAVMMFIFTASW